MASRKLARSLLSIAVLVAVPAPAPGGAPPALVPAAEAHKHVGEVVTVEMVVRSTGRTPKGALLFLNSHELFRANSTVTVVLDPDAQDTFRKAGIANPETHYFRKLVHVTGKVRHYKSVTDLPVGSPDQIKILGTNSDAGDAVPVAGAPEAPATAAGPSTEFLIGAAALGVFGLGLGVFGASRLVARKTASPKPEGSSAAPTA